MESKITKLVELEADVFDCMWIVRHVIQDISISRKHLVVEVSPVQSGDGVCFLHFCSRRSSFTNTTRRMCTKNLFSPLPTKDPNAERQSMASKFEDPVKC
jgi:hypothetical protein